jgi:cold shock protein
MAHGILTWFDLTRGVGSISRAGFVSRDAGGAEVLVHRAQLTAAGMGDLVRFNLQPIPRVCARWTSTPSDPWQRSPAGTGRRPSGLSRPRPANFF